ncbi:tRNA (adenosine(37)-N6)-threonylcarbamoyltransferase complex dimerization subunit type 1 TsaB [Paraglaciecola marina]|uniref:tRNA (adenosine(37)-N6)-threonylcarbamoyltransferase complex dimerization subunit type 1 TsaB n=1 Tax=Paraglaciecola marina TaxID=2500157 RepID=UPI00105E728F|nr:tRNA (adenosine(37)-N6)-threonylcarbamoyltransferase complex dimerization subunit type 1 TsaB [Paraglaciecola marina]
MNLLVIDTATEACSVAVQVDGKIYNRFEICPQQHSQRILPMIDEVLHEANITLKELDYLGFGRGPGSFTGVRIATGILQGLSLGTGLKVVGISTLAAMAQEASDKFKVNHVFAAIDARMAEVYFAEYAFSEGIVRLIAEESVLPPEVALPETAENCEYLGVGTGWAAYEALDVDNKVNVISDVIYPNALYMLPLALAQIEAGLAVDVEDIQPVYLRDKVTWKKLPGRE